MASAFLNAGLLPFNTPGLLPMPPCPEVPDARVCNLSPLTGEYTMTARNQDHAVAGRGAQLDGGKLARRAHEGDQDAFWQLAQRHSSSVYRIAAALVGPGPEAEDAAQDALVRAFESIRRYDPQRPFGPWLRGVAVKVAQQHRRRLARQSRRRAGPSEAEPGPAAEAKDPDHTALLKALGRLDDAHRIPLTLFYIEDATVAEVAETLGMRPGTVRVRLHRGREKLRRSLSREEGSDPGS